MKENVRMLVLLFVTKPLYVCGYFLNVLLTSLPGYLGNVLFLKLLIDNITTEYDFGKLMLYLILFSIFLILADLYAAYFTQMIQPIAKESLEAMFFGKLRQRAQMTDLMEYDSPSFYNDFYFLSKNISSITDTVLENFSQLFAGVVNLCLTFGMLSSIGMEILLLAAGSVVCTYVMNALTAKLSHTIKLESTIHERRRDYFAGLFFRRECIKERKMSLIDQVLKREMQHGSQDIVGVHRKYGTRLACQNFVKSFAPETLILNFGLLAFLIYKVVVAQSITIAEFVASFNGINVIVSAAMVVFGTCTAGLKDSKYNIQKYENFLKGSASVQEDAGEVSHNENKGNKEDPGEIEFRDVCFAYNKEAGEVLKGINLTLHQGEKIAIIGRNGSGKTTLAYLLMGLYEPQSGEILVGGVPRKIYSKESYSQSFTSFFQNETPWMATVAENVAFDISYREDDVRDSLERGQLALGEQLQRQVGKEFDSDGLILSGGQMQKLMIAHCLYAGNPYIVMDEPSSALDPSAEFEFNQQVMKLTKRTTTVFISHRLTTVKMADYIYVINDGTVVQQGTHQELSRQDGLYREMWEIQTRNAGSGHYDTGC